MIHVRSSSRLMMVYSNRTSDKILTCTCADQHRLVWQPEPAMTCRAELPRCHLSQLPVIPCWHSTKRAAGASGWHRVHRSAVQATTCCI